MTMTVSATRKYVVPIARANDSEKRPKRSPLGDPPPNRSPKLLRSPLGLSRRTSRRELAVRAMRCPPPGRNGCGRSAYGLGRGFVARRTSPVVRQQIVEDIVNGHHPDESVVLIHDGHLNQVVAGQDARHLGRAGVGL